MVYNKDRIQEAIYIYDQIATAKNMGSFCVEVSNVDYEENIQSLRSIGYDVVTTKNGIKIKWKEI